MLEMTLQDEERGRGAFSRPAAYPNQTYVVVRTRARYHVTKVFEMKRTQL